MTRALERTQSERTTLYKEVAAQRELLNNRKSRAKDKRIASNGRFVFSTHESVRRSTAIRGEDGGKKESIYKIITRAILEQVVQ